MVDFAAQEVREKAGVQQTPAQVIEKLSLWMSTVLWFADRMLAKMMKNSHKRGWHWDEISYLRYRLAGELAELDEVLARANPSADDIIDECSDIANFALMIADRARSGGVPITYMTLHGNHPRPCCTSEQPCDAHAIEREF